VTDEILEIKESQTYSLRSSLTIFIETLAIANYLLIKLSEADVSIRVCALADIP
jgi:hypothetical protein